MSVGTSTTTCPTGTARYSTATIVAHEQIADRTWRLRVDCPDLAARALPGQFAMLRIPGRSDPLLGRPLAVYDVFDAAGAPGHRPARHADFVYLVHGRFTTALATLRPGAPLAVWGPLGNGFDPPAVEHLVLVAGGIGQTALLALARERSGLASYGASPRRLGHPAKVTFCWGARHAGMFGDVEDFRAAGCDVHLATLDGSAGLRGTVVDLLDTVVPPRPAGSEPASGSLHVACCGPAPMMAAVGRWAADRGVGCHVSLEEPMACGIGACFTCVAKIRDESGGWDYRRTCIEGPVFDAQAIAW